ncbi:RebB family R body protein [Zooshikella sp. RANM57]|uniref:RebB family R body protein n=1 Tax=Zooshikella sp. RANM57 TaxID=3425863 RepID=UPI003D6DB928
MAFPGGINDQITSSIVNFSMLNQSILPATVMTNLNQSISIALANAAQNASDTQIQSNISVQAVSVMSTKKLFMDEHETINHKLVP